MVVILLRFNRVIEKLGNAGVAADFNRTSGLMFLQTGVWWLMPQSVISCFFLTIRYASFNIATKLTSTLSPAFSFGL